MKTIKLQKPDLKAGVPLMEAMANRHSRRDFKQDALSHKHLSELLWAAYGINRSDGKRTVPSALAVCPLTIYAVMADGIYAYSPETDSLEMLKEGDFREKAGSQPFVKSAPLNLLYFADFGKYKNTGNEMIDHLMADDNVKTRFALLDAGHCSQNVYLYCASEGLGVVTRGMADERFFKELLQLGDDHQFHGRPVSRVLNDKTGRYEKMTIERFRIEPVYSIEDLEQRIAEVGFLPMFPSCVAGFSVHDNTPNFWRDDEDGPWEWKGPIIRNGSCAEIVSMPLYRRSGIPARP